MDSTHSFGSIINTIRTNNNEALNSEFEEMPELERQRTFPRNIDRDDANGPDWFTERFRQYHDGETEFFPETPDPWKVNEGHHSSFLLDRGDMVDSVELGKEWMNFLKLPPTTLIIIRTLLNMISDTIEVEGPRTPIGITRIFAEFIINNFPEDIPRTGNPPVPDIDDECVEMVSMIEVYNVQFRSGLKSRKNFANYNKWAGRRNNFNNWAKFSTLLSDLANELGPFSHSLLNSVVDKIDGILAHQHLNSDDKAVIINGYSTSAKKWAVAMFTNQPVVKIIKGKPVCTKSGSPAPVEIILRVIMPKIIARENAEQLEADIDNVGPGPMQAEEFTISEHELDSGIL